VQLVDFYYTNTSRCTFLWMSKSWNYLGYSWRHSLHPYKYHG